LDWAHFPVAFDLQLHLSLAAKVNRGPLAKPSHSSSGTALLSADQRPLHYTATQLYTAVIIAGENPLADPQD